MPEIAGYADTISVKGQYYRLASSPKPVVYTGDISTISDDLLSKAMFVTRNATNTASLPNNFGTNFLITTVEYGSGNYLQTSYMVQTGYECYEYRRIYSSGNWTAWVGVDSAIAAASSAASNAKETADQAAADAGTAISNAANIKANVDSLSNTISSVSENVSTLTSRVNALSTNSNISNSYTITKTGGNANWTSATVSATRSGNIVNMQIEFVFKRGKTYNVGDNTYTGTLSGGPLPIYQTKLIAYYSKTLFACNINVDGSVQVRVLGTSLTPGGSGNDASKLTGTFITNG